MSNERTFYLEAGWQLIVTIGPPDSARLVSPDGTEFAIEIQTLPAFAEQ